MRGVRITAAERAAARRRARRVKVATYSAAVAVGAALIGASLVHPAAAGRRSVGEALLPNTVAQPHMGTTPAPTSVPSGPAPGAGARTPLPPSRAGAPSSSVTPSGAEVLPSSVSASTSPSRPLSVVALGDSVPAGSGCSCAPFPTLYATAVASLTGAPTVSVNLGTPGLTSGALLAQLAPGGPAATAVAQAAVITVTIGANDFSYVPSPQCPRLTCYASVLRSLAGNVSAVLRRIGQLRGGAATAIKVTGYWEVWRDGQVGVAEGADYMQVNDALTVAVNTTLAQAAAATSASYVALDAAFHATSDPAGDTDLLAADGDHPNAAGHRLIADLLKASGLAPLSAIGRGAAGSTPTAAPGSPPNRFPTPQPIPACCAR